MQYKKLIETPYLNFFEIETNVGPYFYVSRNKELFQNNVNTVSIFAKYDDKFILIRQFRHGINKWLIDVPSGLVEDGEHPVDAAKREFEEETGFIFEPIEYSPPLYKSAGMTDENVVNVFGFAKPNGEQKLDELERIHIILASKEDLPGLVHTCDFSNSAWHWLHGEVKGD